MALRHGFRDPFLQPFCSFFFWPFRLLSLLRSLSFLFRRFLSLFCLAVGGLELLPSPSLSGLRLLPSRRCFLLFRLLREDLSKWFPESLSAAFGREGVFRGRGGRGGYNLGVVVAGAGTLSSLAWLEVALPAPDYKRKAVKDGGERSGVDCVLDWVA